MLKVKPSQATQMIYPDGKERAVSEQAPGIVVITEWTNPQVLSSVARKDGTVVGRGTYELSADGKELTATVSGTDASGAPFDQVIVFDRQEGTLVPHCYISHFRPIGDIPRT